ncbi:hypothetical protein [Roseomonas indoligenes]|uniref:Uncharacterized protein n=1 Tax=Roseomonas indoligenes TaxID=2820811 RepID=A0A940S6L3_9PROT|nr:hypothetical protein [Pararoseomonas indoligenes]MBP0492103.1 hypothetical protein [Pararoseomonas indoligenes]
MTTKTDLPRESYEARAFLYRVQRDSVRREYERLADAAVNLLALLKAEAFLGKREWGDEMRAMEKALTEPPEARV